MWLSSIFFINSLTTSFLEGWKDFLFLALLKIRNFILIFWTNKNINYSCHFILNFNTINISFINTSITNYVYIFIVQHRYKSIYSHARAYKSKINKLNEIKRVLLIDFLFMPSDIYFNNSSPLPKNLVNIL